MGVPSLKIKQELNYRRGYTHAHCNDCNYFLPQYPVKGCKGNPLGNEPRCRVIGLENSRRYRINPKYICDKFDNSIKLMPDQRILMEDKWRFTACLFFVLLWEVLTPIRPVTEDFPLMLACFYLTEIVYQWAIAVYGKVIFGS